MLEISFWTNGDSKMGETMQNEKNDSETKQQKERERELIDSNI